MRGKMRNFWLGFKNIAFNHYFAKIICKIVLTFFVLTWVYFIFLDPYFFKHPDETPQTIHATAVGKIFISMLPDAGRFWPLGLSYYNILTIFPYGYSAQAHYMVNCFIFVLFMFVLIKIVNLIPLKIRCAFTLRCF
jgi:hypothetical protein